MPRRAALLITCEHGGAEVPAAFRALFRPHAHLLRTHRASDPGALLVARTLARRLRAPLRASRTTRLLVDLNRSPHHPDLFSVVTRDLPAADKERILRSWYRPHRTAVEAQIEEWVRQGRAVVHVACHSFTPVRNGVRRTTDVGLLYDPSRARERRLVRCWQAGLRAALPARRIHRNAPYRGVADGLPTALRRRWPDASYAGIELEINQRLLGGAPAARLARQVADLLASCLPAPGGRAGRRLNAGP